MTEIRDPDQAEIVVEEPTPYIGQSAFTVDIDDSPKLRALVLQAREFRSLPFEEKILAVGGLALDAMSNAYEAWKKAPDEAERQRGEEIVMQRHPLSYALKAKSGCCRYQGALFFVLAFEAQMGDRHLLQAAPVVPGLNTVFNEVYEGEDLHVISVFTSSLEDKSLDYSRQNPEVFGSAFKSLRGFTFLSYHRTADGKMVMVANPNEHGEQTETV